ncbi:MAG TPA: dihydrodipicolinate synthase family protein [Agriterribacter sp.]|nr:dihydrodipicolinate synthase family protein [Agriterribacter sp.]HRQ49650.1 dihydrodipicolinate synthase family protein [Agriterribacter sp.]
MAIEWNGVFPAMTTKFKEDDTLDLDVLGKNIDAQMEAGIHGLILGGSLGESSTLSFAEKEVLVKFSLQKTAGKIPVLLNVAEGATKNAVMQAQNAEKWGAQAIMLLPPMGYRSDFHETVTFFKTVASSVSIPVMLYSNPIDYRIEVTLDMLEALADIPNIQAIKESSRDVTNVTRIINKFGDRYKVLCGVDTLTVEELLMGAVGVVGGLVCAFPRETVKLYYMVKEGKIKEAVELFRWFLPMLEMDIRPKLVQYIKLTEVQVELGTEYVRAPRLPVTGAEREMILTTVKQALAKRPVFEN